MRRPRIYPCLPMRRRPALASSLAVTLTAVAAATAGVETLSSTTASRVIDRTIICRVPGIGFPDTVRVLGVGGERRRVGGSSSSPRPFVFPPRIGVSTAQLSGEGEGGFAVSIRAGPDGNERYGVVALPRTGCKSTSTRGPLASRGLVGGPLRAFQEGYRCDAPARVVVRVRATFSQPTVLRPDPQFRSNLVARGEIVTGSLAVAAAGSRKPIVLASVQDKGGAVRLFVSSSRCRAQP